MTRITSGLAMLIALLIVGCMGSGCREARAGMGVGYCMPVPPFQPPCRPKVEWINTVQIAGRDFWTPDNRTTASWVPAGDHVTSAKVQIGDHLLFCDRTNAAGTGVPNNIAYDPCWVSQQVDGRWRVDGAMQPANPSWPNGQPFTIRNFDQATSTRFASQLLTDAWLPDPPACPTISANYVWTDCGTTSDSGRRNFTAMQGPADRINIRWPDATTGSPCTAFHDGVTVTVNYACPNE